VVGGTWMKWREGSALRSGRQRLSYFRAVMFTLFANPTEGVDRVRNRVELWRDRRLAHPPPAYEPDPTWHSKLHSALSSPWPCADFPQFEVLWSDLVDSLSGDLELGRGHDADFSVAQAAWCLTRHLRPERVVETGVARGITSRVVLEAMELDARGHLWSIDLPPMREGWRQQAGQAVPERLRVRWTFLRGSSRRLLPSVAARAGALDLFIHDSLHTTRNMTFELETAWAILRSGGALLVDDIGLNAAFDSFVRQQCVSQWLVAKHRDKSHLFGVAIKE
jgi:hypothetical protein